VEKGNGKTGSASRGTSQRGKAATFRPSRNYINRVLSRRQGSRQKTKLSPAKFGSKKGKEVRSPPEEEKLASPKLGIANSGPFGLDESQIRLAAW